MTNITTVDIAIIAIDADDFESILYIKILVAVISQ